MRRVVIVVCLFGAAVVCGISFLAISNATIVPLVARGSGINGVQVTPGGWLALLTSILGTGGFTVAGIVSALVSRIGTQVSERATDTLFSEVVELTASFTALMRDKTNRAVQRRFFFALVDSARLINGCETSHDGGVIVIRYSGYADPVGAAQQGEKL